MTADSGTPVKPNSAGALVTPPSADAQRPAGLEVQAGAGESPSPGAQLWLRRAAVLLFVTLCAVVGVLLVLLPWSLQWTANRYLWPYPELRSALANGFVRGLCSGLGILNLWIGFREAVRYHEGQGTVK